MNEKRPAAMPAAAFQTLLEQHMVQAVKAGISVAEL